MAGATDHNLPGAYVREVVELVRHWDVSTEALLRGLAVRLDALRDPATRVPLAVCAEIVDRAHRLTGESALAFHVGTQMRLSSHGFLGFAAMTAETLREAIELAVRFASTRTTALALSLYIEGETASLVIEERAPLGRLREFAVLSLIVGLWRIGQSLAGRPLLGVAECSFPAPEFVASVPLAVKLIRFDQPASRLLFPAATLDVPLAGADPIATQLARAQCERELAAVVDAGFLGRVRAAIVAREGGAPSVAEVARELHVSTRTLKRKLADHGATFSAILDDIRRQRALLLLDNRELSIGEVAFRLGYSEVANFTRAFRKWTGKTPAAHRAR